MDVYILSGARTASSPFLSDFVNTKAPVLGGFAISGAIKRTKIDINNIDEVIMGNVLTAGVGQAPARQAALNAGLPESTPCTTINKVCGSGMKSVIIGAQSIKSLDSQLVICGGMENMSMSPHFVLNSRTGNKFGNIKLVDSMLSDGLTDAGSQLAMGNYAEKCVSKYSITREELDLFSQQSFERAQEATRSGIFKNEIEAVVVKNRKNEKVIDSDEGVFKADFEKMKRLKAAFVENGKVTAANSSSLNDGAAALVLAGEKYKDLAKFKINSYASHAHQPEWFTTAPISAMRKNLEKAGLAIEDIDLFEINEAFAVVTLQTIKELKLDRDKVNIFGGGVSLGHPLGASGTRIIVTLMNALEQRKLKRGMASICIGGGEALSIIIERI